jgi:hypothetical protein
VFPDRVLDKLMPHIEGRRLVLLGTLEPEGLEAELERLLGCSAALTRETRASSAIPHSPRFPRAED